jgi:hypothetical protein
MQPRTTPTQPPARNFRPALRVGLIAGLTLGLAEAAQQFASSDEMRILGTMIIITGFSVAGFFAARESGATQRAEGTSAGAISGLIAGVLVSLVFVGVSLLLSLDPEYMRVMQSQVERQVATQAQMQQLQTANIDLRTLTQFSLGLAVACCGLGFPLIGLLLGAMGGGMGAFTLK